jgi:hypothetical protein
MVCQLPREIISQIVNTNNFSIKEIRGGISKQVYKLYTDLNLYMLYIWLRPLEGNLTENKTFGSEYLFADGFSYFIYNTKYLTDIGIRVPQIIKSGYYETGGFNYAIVEFLKGQSFQEYIDNGNNLLIYADKLTELMEKLSAQERSFYGSPMQDKPLDIPAEQLTFNFYIEELRIASELDNEVAYNNERFINLLKEKLLEINSSKDRYYSLIHGELTPPHIFILEDNNLAIIDIEALKFFDKEYDWAVIKLMYGNDIPLPNTINKKRLEFYMLCLQIGYLSVAVDYIINVDKNDTFFKGLRNSNMLSIMRAVTSQNM